MFFLLYGSNLAVGQVNGMGANITSRFNFAYRLYLFLLYLENLITVFSGEKMLSVMTRA
jgi:hypothetical protein